METIYKYPLRIIDRQKIYTFKTFVPLSIQVQNGEPVLWALVDTASDQTARKIVMHGTGNEIAHSVINYPHLGTVQIDGFVWHYFLNPTIITEIKN